jgi:hypothetical protein
VPDRALAPRARRRVRSRRPDVVRRRTRTPRLARVQRSVRCAPWSLCAMSVGPTPSHVVRARWPCRAARAPPLACRPLHVAAVPRPYCPHAVPWSNQSIGHRLHLCPAIKAPSSPLLVRDTEPRRSHHCCRRGAPCPARARGHLSTPRASPHT